MVEYEFTPAVQAEFQEAQDWYAGRDQEALTGFIQAMAKAIDNIRHFPNGFLATTAYTDSQS